MRYRGIEITTIIIIIIIIIISTVTTKSRSVWRLVSGSMATWLIQDGATMVIFDVVINHYLINKDDAAQRIKLEESRYEY